MSAGGASSSGGRGGDMEGLRLLGKIQIGKSMGVSEYCLHITEWDAASNRGEGEHVAYSMTEAVEVSMEPNSEGDMVMTIADKETACKGVVSFGDNNKVAGVIGNVVQADETGAMSTFELAFSLSPINYVPLGDDGGLAVGATLRGHLTIPGHPTSPYVVHVDEWDGQSGSGRHFAYGDFEDVTLSLDPVDGKIHIEDDDTRLVGGLEPISGRILGATAQTNVVESGTFVIHGGPVRSDNPEAAAAVVGFGEVDLSVHDSSSLGGKGLRLAEMTQAGARVPPGVVVTAGACRDHMATLYVGADGDQAAALTASSLDDGLVTQIAAWWQSLTPDQQGQGVAVRSSATNEDGADASFAGMYETYLNIHGVDEVCAHVLRCWGSLFSARAAQYVESTGVSDGETPAMAVVIQLQVAAAAAGVMFTVNPQSATYPEVVVEAVHGLGELLVSAEITPTTYVWDWEGEAVVDQTDSHQAEMLVIKDGGGTQRLPCGDKATVPPLTLAQLTELVAMGLDIAEHYGKPQDIEWAVDQDDVLYILQSRPITVFQCYATGGQWYPHFYSGFFPITESLQGNSHHRFMKRWQNPRLEGDTKAFFFGHCYTRYDGNNVIDEKARFQEVAEELEAAAEAFKAKFEPLREAMLTDALGADEADEATLHARLPQILALYAESGDLSWAVGYAGRAFADVLGAVVAQVNARGGLAASGAPVDVGTLMSGIPSRCGNAMDDLDAIVRRVRKDGDLFRTVSGICTKVAPGGIFDAIGALAAGGEGPSGGTAGDGGSESTEDRVRQSGKAQELVDAIDEYLHTFYWMSDDDQSIAQDTHWMEHPIAVERLFAQMIQAVEVNTASGLPVPMTPTPTALMSPRGFPSMVATTTAAGRKKVGTRGDDEGGTPLERREAALERIRLGLVAAGDGDLEALFHRTIGLVEVYTLLKEDIHITTCQLSYFVFRSVRALGPYMVAAGQIAAPEDVWCFTETSLNNYLQLPAATGSKEDGLAELNAMVRTRKLFRNMTTPTWVYDGSEIAGDADVGITATGASSGASVLNGRGLATGVAKGIARVISTLTEADEVQPGDILVTQRTTAGWTPLFFSIAGLVVEQGGMLSHSAIVARERGIPVVVLRDARTEIVSGERLVINGTSGEILRPADSLADITSLLSPVGDGDGRHDFV